MLRSVIRFQIRNLLQLKKTKQISEVNPLTDRTARGKLTELEQAIKHRTVFSDVNWRGEVQVFY